MVPLARALMIGWFPKTLIAIALVCGCNPFEPDHCGPIDPPIVDVRVLDAGDETDACEPLCPTTAGKASCRFITTTTDAGSTRAVECTQTEICD